MKNVPEAEQPLAKGLADRGELEVSPESFLYRRFFRLRTLISFLVALGILVFFVTRLDLDLHDTWAQLRQSDLLLYLGALAVYYASFPIRGWRWRALLINAGYQKGSGIRLPSVWGMAEVVLLGWFASAIAPAKLGDAYRAYLLKKNAQVSFSRTVGTLVAERSIDTIVLFGMMAGAALGLLGRRDAPTALGIVELGFALSLIIVFGLIAFYRFGGRLERLFPAPLQSKFLSLKEGTFQSFKQLPLLLGASVLVWLCEAGRLYLVARSLNVPMELLLVLFISLAGSLLTTIPFTPGGLGIVEAGMTGLLMMAVPKEMALTVVLLDRSISYWSLIVFGLLVFLLGRQR